MDDARREWLEIHEARIFDELVAALTGMRKGSAEFISCVDTLRHVALLRSTLDALPGGDFKSSSAMAKVFELADNWLDRNGGAAGDTRRAAKVTQADIERITKIRIQATGGE